MSREPVAIVGIGCRFPGGVVDTDSFWRLLIEGREAIGEIPADRFDLERFYDAQPATPGHVMTRRGGYLDQIDGFDAAFFGIAPRDAERMDPQQRVLLETAWEALEDAGIDPMALAGTNAAVFMGQWTGDFENRLFADPDALDLAMTLGSGRYGASARVSFALGLRGPSLAVDAACSSGLACVHLAVQSLRSGECNVALAGAANLILQPHIHIAYSQSRMMAPDGRCKFGDASGDGYVRSEGAGVFVLKRLADATAAGDRILAVVRGSAVNNDGRASGVMGRPARQGQVELLRQAYADAGVAPSTVAYIEAHGTGTRAGDPVELGALADVLGPGRAPERRAWVGSVKTNIGHTEAAAGVAGLIKAVLVLRHGQVPPSLHFDTPNPNVPWSTLPLAIPRQAEALGPMPEKRLAGVSAYGIGGTNAHVVLEAAPATAPTPATAAMDRAGPAALLLPISARSPEALRALAGRYASLLAQSPDAAAVCHAAATRRGALEHRAAFAAPGRAELVAALTAFAEGRSEESSVHVAEGQVVADAEGRLPAPRVAFVCPGQGGQWVGMARELLRSDAGFAATVARCEQAARPWMDTPLRTLLDDASAAASLERIDHVQPLLVALAIAYADWLRARGVEPAAVVGHSLGEVAAAHIAGAIDLEDAMRIVCRRSALMRQTSGQGAMLLVELGEAEARDRLRGLEAHVAVAVNNGPRSCVLSGDPATLASLQAELEAARVFCRPVKVDVASHSPQMEGPARDLATELSGLKAAQARVPLVSTVTGEPVQGPELGADYWARNLRQPVQFARAVQRLLGEGVRCFVELGPHPVLAPAIEQNAQGAGVEATAACCGQREVSDAVALAALLGTLWVRGQPVRWADALPAPTGDVTLPSYPWQRERLWVRQARPMSSRAMAAASGPSLAEGTGSWLHQLRWRTTERGAPMGAPGRWLLVAEDERALAPFAAALESAGAVARAVRLSALDAALDAALSEARAGSALRGVVLLQADDPARRFDPVAALQSLLRSPSGISPRLWIATVGATLPAAPAGGGMAVHAASAWGVGRVIAEEHPEAWGGLVDLDPAAAPGEQANQLASELLGDGREQQVTWRAGQRHVLRLEPLLAEGDELEPAPQAWRSGTATLLTGAFGGVGRLIAKALVEQGARRLVLLGRQAPPPRESWARPEALSPAQADRVQFVLELEAAGAAVHVLSADVSDAASLREALAGYAAQRFPPIRSVVHAAAVMDIHLLRDLDRAAFERVLSPKLDGALALQHCLPDLDAFIAFSSMASVIGAPGLANYVAANAGLDAVVADRRARGLPAAGIQWGPWEGVGLHANDAAAFNEGELARQGIRGFRADFGVNLFKALAGHDAGNLAVMQIDWAALAAARRGRNLQLFEGRLAGLGTDGSEAPLAERLAQAPAAERRRVLTGVVRDALGRVLKMAPERIDANRPLGSYGLTSLMAMELRNRLEAALSRPLSATIAWNYPTVLALVAFLAGDEPQGAAAAVQAGPPPASAHDAPALAEVAEMSDEEAARMLRRRR